MKLSKLLVIVLFILSATSAGFAEEHLSYSVPDSLKNNTQLTLSDRINSAFTPIVDGLGKKKQSSSF